MLARVTTTDSKIPAVGQPAPDFTLATHDGKAKVRLGDFRGRKPVVLIFGNFT